MKKEENKYRPYTKLLEASLYGIPLSTMWLFIYPPFFLCILRRNNKICNKNG